MRWWNCQSRERHVHTAPPCIPVGNDVGELPGGGGEDWCHVAGEGEVEAMGGGGERKFMSDTGL